MRPDVVEHLPVVLRLAVQVGEGGDLAGVAVEVLVFQGSERALADAVLAGALGPGADVEQLGVVAEAGQARSQLEGGSRSRAHRSCIQFIAVDAQVDAPLGAFQNPDDVLEIGIDVDRDRDLRGDEPRVRKLIATRMAASSVVRIGAA